jgi:hypothetical protein
MSRERMITGVRMGLGNVSKRNLLLLCAALDRDSFMSSLWADAGDGKPRL